MAQVGSPISKLLAANGVCSRRAATELVQAGRVMVNGVGCTHPGTRVAHGDIVRVDQGEPLRFDRAIARLWRFHKPVGLICTNSDPQGRTTIFDRLPSNLSRVVSVGRLDTLSEGLMLLTNSGALSRQLELPSSGYVRRYHALLSTGERSVTQEIIHSLAKGLKLVDGTRFRPMHAKLTESEAKPESETPPESDDVGPYDVPYDGGQLPYDVGPYVSGPYIPVRPKSAERSTRKSWVRMWLSEGKKREVRRAWSHYGFTVTRLVREAYGPFELGQLAPGELEEVPQDDVRALLAGKLPLSADERDGLLLTADASYKPRRYRLPRPWTPDSQ